MKPYLRRSLITAWVAALTVLLVRFWYAEPDRFPGVLKSVGNAIVDLAGTGDAEYSADIELLYLVLVALLVVTFVTWLAFIGVQRIVTSKRDLRG
jgi:hypothetical protein